MTNYPLDKATIYLSEKDVLLAGVIAEVGELPLALNRDIFSVLLHGICSQQISKAAADAIWGRFCDRFENRVPNADRLARMRISTIRKCGFSERKAEYTKALSSYARNGGLDYRRIADLSDEEIVSELTTLPGIGRWTVEMLLIFSIGRPDILPLADVGIQQAMMRLFGFDLSGKKLRLKMQSIAESWQPYRSTACRYLWRWRRTG
jgi:DNA-3-methyladenine glycosylase II